MTVERRTNGILLIVEDDGRGFDPDEVVPHTDGDGNRSGSSTLGLIGMRERVALVGGTLAIESAPGNGTTVFVRVPVARQGA